MVIYRGADGKPGYHQTDDIHDAVNFVEQMTNNDGVEHARIFRLEEVVFQYRAYYRVELTEGQPRPVETAPVAGNEAGQRLAQMYLADSDTDSGLNEPSKPPADLDLIHRGTNGSDTTKILPPDGIDITNGSDTHLDLDAVEVAEMGTTTNEKGLFGL